jgi:PAS domain S-box-containing protein
MLILGERRRLKSESSQPVLHRRAAMRSGEKARHHLGKGSQAMKCEVLLFPQPALQLIYDTAPIGLACLSPDCRYLQINQRLTEICGISVEDHLGRSVRDCVPALADSVEQIVRSIMQTGEPVVGVEVAGQRADQTVERAWITYWHPLRAPSGEIVAVNVAAEEITERKRSEQEMRRARETAEQTLAHLRETQASLVEAEKLAALGRLVAGVAHEINNPVGSSVTVASTLQRRYEIFAAEVGRGEIRRSALNEFLDAVRDASAQLIANLDRASELVHSFKQVAAGTAEAGAVARHRLRARSHHGQLARTLWAGGKQSRPQFGRARVPGRKDGNDQLQGSLFRRPICRNPSVRRWLRHEPARAAAGIRSLLHHAPP